MMYRNEYIHIGSSRDLKGFDRALYRAFEILPAFLAWLTLAAMVFFSWKKPVWAAVFIIVFDLYWLVKTILLSFYLRSNWNRMRRNMSVDWTKRLDAMKWEHLWQLVVLPVASEPVEVLEETMKSLAKTTWPRDRMIVILSVEERFPDAHEKGGTITEKYRSIFGGFLELYHPYGLPGEMAGKGANETWALMRTKDFIDSKKIPHENILVSSFDIDTKLFPQYFTCLAWHFLTAEKPYRSSFQPVPLFHNNVWEAGAISRVVATSGTFWQMMQQERPERLTTFSSHSMNYKSLMDAGYWQKNIVSEDSRIFWNHYFAYGGDWRTVPLSYPVSMDANLARSTWQTIKNIYKQQRRWGWGVENVPYILFGFVKQKDIAVREKLRHAFNSLEGFWSWSTNALLIFALGWLPLILGGREFSRLPLSYNLPRITRFIMTLAMVGIVTSAIISVSILKKTKGGLHMKKRAFIFLQWILMPVTIIIFGALPGLEAQTRLALGGGWRLGFWVTPKHRRKPKIE